MSHTSASPGGDLFPSHCCWGWSFSTHGGFILGGPEVYRTRPALKNTTDQAHSYHGLWGLLPHATRLAGEDRCVTPGKSKEGRFPIRCSLHFYHGLTGCSFLVSDFFHIPFQKLGAFGRCCKHPVCLSVTPSRVCYVCSAILQSRWVGFYYTHFMDERMQAQRSGLWNGTHPDSQPRYFSL